MKKLLFIPSWYPTPKKPISAVFIEEQIRALSKIYDCRVLYVVPVGLRSFFKNRHYFDIGKLQRFEQNGISVDCYHLLWIKPFEKENYKNFRMVLERGISNLMFEGFNPDILHSHVVLPAGWAAVTIGRKFQIPTVLTEHSSPFDMHLQTTTQKDMVSYTLNNASRIISVSPSLKQDILNFQQNIEDKITIIGNLIETEIFTPESLAQSRADIVRFLFVGFLTKQKGLDYLIEAANILYRRGIKGFNVTIGGEGVLRKELENKVCVDHLDSYFTFLGLLNRQQVLNAMKQCDVFVLPSIHETFGVVLGEAMALGKPAIATRCGGPEYVVTSETGILVDPANPEQLADAMQAFINRMVFFDPKVIRQSIERRFGTAVFLQSIGSVYEEVSHT